MSTHHHIILQYVFDVQFSSRARATALQEQVSRLFRQQIEPGTAQLLQRLAPPDITVALDTLQLDLGVIRYKELDRDLPAAVMAALEKALADIFLYGAPERSQLLKGRVEVKKGPDRLYELLQHYLLTGAMPWWATAAEREQPGDIILRLAADGASRLGAFIRATGQFSYVRERMSQQFPAPVLHQVATVLEPAEAAFIIGYSREVVLLQQRRQVLQTATGELERAVWLFVLNYLLVESGSNFNRKQFVRSNLEQLARHFNVAYTTLLQLFYRALGFYREALPAAMVGGFIRELYLEAQDGSPAPYWQPGPADNIAIETALQAPPAIQAAWLRYYRLHGALPPWAPPLMPALLQQLVARVAAKAGMMDEPDVNIPAQWPAGFMQADAAPDEPAVKQLLRDLVLYRLVYGSTPWWGRAYAHFSLNSLLQQLADGSLAQAVAVMQYAGMLPAARGRFIAGVETALFFRIARAAGVSAAEQDAYESLYAWLQAAQALLPQELPALLLQQQLLKAFWQAWAAAGRRQVEIATFVAESLQYWSAAAGITYGSMAHLLQRPPAGVKGSPGYRLLSAPLQSFLHSATAAREALYRSAAAAWELDDSRSYHPLVHFVSRGTAPAQTAAITQAGQTVAEWLRHWLLTGEGPSSAPGLTLPETTWLAGRMLEWLFTHNRERIHDIQSAIRSETAILNRLAELRQVTAVHTGLQQQLSAWMEQTVSLPTADTLVPVDGLWQVLPELPAPPAARRQQAVPAAAAGMLRRFRHYDLLTGAQERQQLLEAAADLLSYFLTWQQLPATYGAPSAAVANDLLKQAVILLFREKPALLHALFSDARFQLRSRLRIYDLFNPPAGILESNIRESLDAFAVQDGLLLLQETAGEQRLHNISGFRDAIRFYRRQPRQERDAFYKKLLQHPAMIRQAARQLDDAILLEMAADIDIGWSAHTAAALTELQQWLGALATGSLEKERLSFLFRQFHLMLLGGLLTLHNATDYAARFLEFLQAEDGNIAAILMEQLAEATKPPDQPSYTHLRDILPALQQHAGRYVQSRQYGRHLRQSLYEDDMRLLYPDQARGVPPSLPATPPPPPEREPTPEWAKIRKPEVDKIYIANAGLVLLHPFLPTAFGRLQWLEAGRFVSVAAQHRAVHFLQFLVNGQEAHPEHALALNKLLCGLPLETPLPFEMPLTDEEKTLGEELLQVVIQQWPEVSGTPPDGFRASFLQREGALRQTEEAWFLRVEQRGYDVLLDSLPWGIGLVQTSWMPKILYTEWVYS